MSDPYSPPSTPLETHSAIDYIGFWKRFAAQIVDLLLLVVLTYPALYWIYGSEYFTGDQIYFGFWDAIINYVFPPIVVLIFWHFKSATPGKMMVDAQIVDARTGEKPTTGQFVGRYLAYFPSLLVLGLGYLWAAFDPRKQSWHDKLAGTVVVRR